MRSEFLEGYVSPHADPLSPEPFAEFDFASLDGAAGETNFAEAATLLSERLSWLAGQGPIDLAEIGCRVAAAGAAMGILDSTAFCARTGADGDQVARLAAEFRTITSDHQR